MVVIAIAIAIAIATVVVAMNSAKIRPWRNKLEHHHPWPPLIITRGFHPLRLQIPTQAQTPHRRNDPKCSFPTCYSNVAIVAIITVAIIVVVIITTTTTIEAVPELRIERYRMDLSFPPPPPPPHRLDRKLRPRGWSIPTLPPPPPPRIIISHRIVSITTTRPIAQP